MDYLINTNVKLALLVLALGIDTVAVAVGLGISGIGRNNRLRIGVCFAFFEGLMPLVGFFLGHAVGSLLGNIATIVGTTILFGIGMWIIKEAFSKEGKRLEIATWKSILLTSLSVSMDELAVGFSMGTLGLPIIPAVIVIASQAFVLTFAGTALGNRIGERLTERAELVAGCVLCGLALVLLLENFQG